MTVFYLLKNGSDTFLIEVSLPLEKSLNQMGACPCYWSTYLTKMVLPEEVT